MAAKTIRKSANALELEDWVLDLVRVGAAGNAGGVRQLANRIARFVPAGVSDPGQFREAIGQALAEAASNSTRSTNPLRKAEQSQLPTDQETSLPLVQLELEPTSSRPVLAPDLDKSLDRLLRERERSQDLLAAGLKPSRVALITGPPGVGKTMTATYIAYRLGLPLLTIDLASVMSSYLGRTGQNLRAALDYGRTHDAVVLVDEFDALAKRRDDSSDIGELKRLVNVLLLELERWPSSSLLVAATNHPHLLDPAAERRFDLVLNLGLPDRETRRRIFESAWPHGDLEPNLGEVAAELLADRSGSAVSAVALLAAKRVFLEDTEPVEAVAAELACLGPISGQARDTLIRSLRDKMSLSNREIARLVGISHPTVAAALKRAKK